MVVYIQGVPERMPNINKIKASFNKIKVEAIIAEEKQYANGWHGFYPPGEKHPPYDPKNPPVDPDFPPFIEILKKECNGYRLYFHDDVILSPLLEEYLPELENIMSAQGVDILSLFAQRSGYLNSQYALGKTIAALKWSAYRLALIFSPRANELMRKYIDDYNGAKHIPAFMRGFLDLHNMEIHVHLPSLVQHDLSSPSRLGPFDTVMMTSGLYDETYIESKIKGTAERERFNPDDFGKYRKIVRPWEKHFELYFMEKHYDMVKSNRL